METQVYEALINDEKYTLYFSSFPNIYLNVKCVTIISERRKIQCFSYPDNGKTIVSYTQGQQTFALLEIMSTFLSHMSLPLPPGVSTASTHIALKHIRTNINSEYLVFSTHTYSFRIYIKENPYNYAIRVGGKEFRGCIELFIDKPHHPAYALPKLQQIYSEPECWHDLGKKGNVVDMIKGALQLCQMLFGVNQFQFEDASKIECGTTNMSRSPPRKLDTPFSLPHLYLATQEMTWYEASFNAFVCERTERIEYRKAVEHLTDDSKTSMDFETMASLARLSIEQKAELKPLFLTSNSWHAFFESIPKNRRCFVLFNWLPTFLDNYVLHFKPLHHDWCIWLGSLGIFEKELNPEEDRIAPMERTDLFIEMDPEYVGKFGGGGKKRDGYGKTRRGKGLNKRTQTRKHRTHILSLSSS